MAGVLCYRKKRSAAKADAVTLSDTYLAPAIQRGLLQPLENPEQQAWWVSGDSQITFIQLNLLASISLTNAHSRCYMAHRDVCLGVVES